MSSIISKFNPLINKLESYELVLVPNEFDGLSRIDYLELDLINFLRHKVGVDSFRIWVSELKMKPGYAPVSIPNFYFVIDMRIMTRLIKELRSEFVKLIDNNFFLQTTDSLKPGHFFGEYSGIFKGWTNASTIILGENADIILFPKTGEIYLDSGKNKLNLNRLRIDAIHYPSKYKEFLDTYEIQLYKGLKFLINKRILKTCHPQFILDVEFLLKLDSFKAISNEP